MLRVRAPPKGDNSRAPAGRGACAFSARDWRLHTATRAVYILRRWGLGQSHHPVDRVLFEWNDSGLFSTAVSSSVNRPRGWPAAVAKAEVKVTPRVPASGTGEARTAVGEETVLFDLEGASLERRPLDASSKDLLFVVEVSVASLLESLCSLQLIQSPRRQRCRGDSQVQRMRFAVGTVVRLQDIIVLNPAGKAQTTLFLGPWSSGCVGGTFPLSISSAERLNVSGSGQGGNSGLSVVDGSHAYEAISAFTREREGTDLQASSSPRQANAGRIREWPLKV
ncbi:hypothetical protein CSUI_009601 [Cystoisospora suis]|uniref:Uncharacterized protein n=1 Tax=Cystoisospora suis TaxID=483139 RepID=A0A2C6KJL4_9APIC|nr:hypothetical protein CSUI_009601 [Cystoisospora suis]